MIKVIFFFSANLRFLRKRLTRQVQTNGKSVVGIVTVVDQWSDQRGERKLQRIKLILDMNLIIEAGWSALGTEQSDRTNNSMSRYLLVCLRGLGGNIMRRRLNNGNVDCRLRLITVIYLMYLSWISWILTYRKTGSSSFYFCSSM